MLIILYSRWFSKSPACFKLKKNIVNYIKAPIFQHKTPLNTSTSPTPHHLERRNRKGITGTCPSASSPKPTLPRQNCRRKFQIFHESLSQPWRWAQASRPRVCCGWARGAAAGVAILIVPLVPGALLRQVRSAHFSESPRVHFSKNLVTNILIIKGSCCIYFNAFPVTNISKRICCTSLNICHDTFPPGKGNAVYLLMLEN